MRIFKKFNLGKKSYKVLNFFCMGPYGQKMVKLISQAGKIRQNVLNLPAYLHYYCPQYM